MPTKVCIFCFVVCLVEEVPAKLAGFIEVRGVSIGGYEGGSTNTSFETAFED